MSRTCHCPDGLVHVSHGIGKVRTHILHILKPSIADYDTPNANEELVLYAMLLERVFKSLIFNVESIPLICRLAFS